MCTRICVYYLWIYVCVTINGCPQRLGSARECAVCAHFECECAVRRASGLRLVERGGSEPRARRIRREAAERTRRVEGSPLPARFRRAPHALRLRCPARCRCRRPVSRCHRLHVAARASPADLPVMYETTSTYSYIFYSIRTYRFYIA